VHVNLVDLVDLANTGRAVRLFASLQELVNYTIEEGKYFPKESAYAGGVLKYLLREILNPHFTQRGRGRGRGRRGRGQRRGRGNRGGAGGNA
jgi:hypothetical protein